MNTKQAFLIALAVSVLGIVSACAPLQPASAVLFGSAAPVDTATRTISLTPGMKYLRVDSGETIAFRAGSRTVGWTFTEAIGGRSSVELSVIFPDLPEAKGIRVIIAPSPLYRGS
ncbi:heavy metal resistance protein CzcE [Cupriavidus sp. SK-3]|uniref:CzcE family metal-binding protein n=1 Tax=Cupriavidus sp. SK-3 TaxID=1470558 RepID=UPI000445662A|nr:CzcE family metal-binding protein [Cupriavidus sp. SK-3]KDP87185.1 heavy metal resistance protein CzcE [Cupriavidus sp. SK-3]